MPLDLIGKIPVIYSHIPKTGGTSIKHYFNLERACHRPMAEMHQAYAVDGEPAAFGYDPAVKGRSAEEMSFKADYLNALFPLLHEQGHIETTWDATYRFSFVRNPWDRVASLYHYYRFDFNFANFEQFLNELHEGTRLFENPYMTHTQTQYLTVGGDFDLHFVGRYEAIASDSERLYDFLVEGDTDEVPTFNQYQRVSANKDQPYTSLYEDFDTIYRVFKYYRDDVLNFKYMFDNSNFCEQTKKCFLRYDYESKKN